MTEKLIQRAERMARSDADRGRVYAYLQTEGRSRLIEAAEQGRVPATAISTLLIDAFGKETMTAAMMRQFCGLACAAILSEAGFDVDQTGVRTWKDPLFSFGSTYRRRAVPTGEASPLLARFIEALTEVEVRQAEALIRARLQSFEQASSSR